MDRSAGIGLAGCSPELQLRVSACRPQPAVEVHPRIVGHLEQDTPLVVVEGLHIVDHLDQGSHLVAGGDIGLVGPELARTVSNVSSTV